MSSSPWRSGAPAASSGSSTSTALELAADSRDHEVGIGPDELMPQVAARLAELLADVVPPVVAVGLSLPGSVDEVRGVSLDAPVMAGWDGVALAPYLADVADVPFFVANDADVLARSELLGAADRCATRWSSRPRPAWGSGSSRTAA